MLGGISSTGAGGLFGMIGLGPGLNRTGWPNASCTGPRVNTWRFGSTCDARDRAVEPTVGFKFADGAPAAVVGDAGCWASNSRRDGHATHTTVRTNVASQLVITIAAGNRLVFMGHSYFFRDQSPSADMPECVAIDEHWSRSQSAVQFSFAGGSRACSPCASHLGSGGRLDREPLGPRRFSKLPDRAGSQKTCERAPGTGD